jgi:hypothetical protein
MSEGAWGYGDPGRIHRATRRQLLESETDANDRPIGSQRQRPSRRSERIPIAVRTLGVEGAETQIQLRPLGYSVGAYKRGAPTPGAAINAEALRKCAQLDASARRWDEAETTP